MKKVIAACLAEIVLLVIVFLSLQPLFARFNIYGEEYAKEHNVIHVKMSDDPDERSYGNEMRILYVRVNGKNLDLSQYDTEDWVWHEDWGYTLFTQGNHDFYIDIDEKIESLDFCYIKQEGSGKCEVYLNDRLEKTLDMYSSKWKNGNLFVSFLSKGTMIFRGLEIWVLLSAVLFACCKTVSLLKAPANNEFRVGIGTFNLTKGLGICLVVLIHSGLCVLTDADLTSGSLLVGVLFIFFTYGLMPAFFILGGFGSKSKKASVSVRNNFREMVVPYAVIALIILVCYFIKTFTSSVYDFGEFKKDAFSLAVLLIHDKEIEGVLYRTIGPLWFTTSFALGSILLSLVLKTRGAVRYIILVLMTVATWFLMSKDFAYYCLTTGLMAALYMYAGYWTYKKKLFYNNRVINALLPVLTPVVVGLAVWNGTSFAISGNNMGNSFILGVLISTVAAVIYVRICLCLNDSFLGRTAFFGMLGRYSYYIFFAHALEYMIIPWKDIAVLFPDNTAFRAFAIFFMRSAVIALITTVFMALSRLFKRRSARSRA